MKSGFRGGRSKDAIVENLELLTGQRGDGLNRAVTLRDLNALGLVKLSRHGSGKVLPRPNPPDDDNDIVSRPSLPEKFDVSGAFGSIVLTWQRADYAGHSYTEVWRNTTDNLSSASCIATVTSSVFGDMVEPGSQFYYWIRHVNVNDIPGPYNNTKGTLGKTSEDIGNVINDITEQMRDSRLVSELNRDIQNAEYAIRTVGRSVDYMNSEGSRAYRAMWAKKAQAGDIKAGIGILADSSGKSQVAVSASQFFVFDPNSGNKLSPVFAIDKGNVIIPKAMIEKATIQILSAQKIVADEVKAGISVHSPNIHGGLVSGSQFRSGDAGFGYGGPYNGYNTFISADGTLRTNRLIVPEGYISHLQLATGAATSVHSADTQSSNSVFLDIPSVPGSQAIVNFTSFAWASGANKAPAVYGANFIIYDDQGREIYRREHRLGADLSYNFSMTTPRASTSGGFRVVISTSLQSRPSHGVELSISAMNSIR